VRHDVGHRLSADGQGDSLAGLDGVDHLTGPVAEISNPNFHVRQCSTSRASPAAARLPTVLIRAPRRVLRAACLVLLVCALAAGAAGASGCGSSHHNTGGGHIAFAKTKFVLHAGLAFGAFHHFIYEPYKAGAFHGPHKFGTFLKAGAAGLFAWHEWKLAQADARASPLLSRVLPFAGLGAALLALGHELRRGKVNPGEIEGANSQIASAHSQSSAAGQPIAEQTPNVP
jgi:hypothetical protein